MPLSRADEALTSDMKQRELHLKSMQRATDAILYETRRYRNVLISLLAVAGAAVGAGLFLLVNGAPSDLPGWQGRMLLDIVLGTIIGVQLGLLLVRTLWGKRLIDRKQSRLYSKYASELHAGRRWQHFYYQDEDISAYVPQILHYLEGSERFESVGAALAFAKKNRHTANPFAARALSTFNEVAAQTTLVIISSADDSGTPTSRLMRFAKSDRPGVWYVTAAPEGRRVHEFQQGRIALITPPTESGGTISSNRVQIKRAQFGFPEVAALYRAQVPGYVDRLTEEDQQRELVYEITLESAKVDTWLEHDVVDFRDSRPSPTQPGN